MNKIKFSFTLICLLQLAHFQVAAGLPVTDEKSRGSSISPVGGCNEPAPSNYHIADYFTNALWVAWDTPASMPFEYNVKVFETSTGNMIQNFNIPGNMTMARAGGLQSNTEYLIRTAAVCPDGTISPSSAESVGTTLIIDLVVSGFTVPNNPPVSATCAINDKGEYCDSQPDETYDGRTTIFKIRPVNSSTQGWYFGVFNPSGACDRIIIKVMPGETGYVFNLVNNARITVSLGGQTVGEFSVWQPQGLTYSKLLCTANTAPSHEIARYGVYYGYPDNEGGCSGSDREEQHSKNAAVSGLIVAPNPFSQTLSVQLPASAEMVSLQMLNLQGARVMEMQADPAQGPLLINTSNVPPGMYFLQAEIDGTLQSTKIIKTE